MRKMLAAVIIGLLSFSALSVFAPRVKAVKDPSCDLNGDLKVDILDMIIAANAFGTAEGVPSPPGWNPLVDKDGDKRITILDLIVFGESYGLVIPPPD